LFCEVPVTEINPDGLLLTVKFEISIFTNPGKEFEILVAG
jgi:hypothetical protein